MYTVCTKYNSHALYCVYRLHCMLHTCTIYMYMYYTYVYVLRKCTCTIYIVHVLYTCTHVYCNAYYHYILTQYDQL